MARDRDALDRCAIIAVIAGKRKRPVMRTATLLLAISLIAAPFLTKTASAQATAPGQLGERVLPVAAGALVGAFATFFVLPLVVPAAAAAGAAGAAGASVTSSPLLAVVGASVGGLIGYEYIP
jgi:hypothetical protein